MSHKKNLLTSIAHSPEMERFVHLVGHRAAHIAVEKIHSPAFQSQLQNQASQLSTQFISQANQLIPLLATQVNQVGIQLARALSQIRF
jgi:hypothetical protein